MANPDFSGVNASGCVAEAAAYASALSALDAASQAADDAYYDWYECDMGNQHRPTTNVAEIVAETESVLQR